MVRIPATALIAVDRGAQVAVLGDGNKVALKSVQLGRDFGDSVEVTAGLAAQDRVIDSPPETLQSGDEVAIGRGRHRRRLPHRPGYPPRQTQVN